MKLARAAVPGAVVLAMACSSALANHGRLERVAPSVSRVAPDGRAFFSTGAQLSPADTDAAADLYEWDDGDHTLVSIPSNPAHDGAPVTAARVAPDGSWAVFVQGGATYRRTGGVTTMLCPVAPETLPERYTLSDVVIFQSFTPLTPDDTDTNWDIYQCSDGQVRLVSDGNSNPRPSLDYLYTDGRLWFRTPDAHVPEDTNGTTDLYEYDLAAGTYQLVAPVPPATLLPPPRSPTGDRFWIQSTVSYTPDDTDGGRNDIYLWRWPSGTFELLTTGPFVANGPAEHTLSSGSLSEDLETLFFLSTDQLTFDDTDATQDLYQRKDGVTTLLAPAQAVRYAKVGNRKVITTSESLSPADTDSVTDVYQDQNGVYTLLSVGPDGGNQPFPAQIVGGSDDLSRVFFSSAEALFSGDNDGRVDLFERFNGQTTWLTKGPTGGTGPHTPSFVGNSGDGTRFFFSTNEALVQADTDTSGDVYVASVAGPGYPRPKAASPISVSLTNAYEQCAAPDRTHGPPLAFDSCSGPQEASDFLTVGTFDANGKAAQMQGQLHVGAVIGNPGTPADEADVEFTLSVSDVSTKELADYTGELRARVPLRVTDRNSTNLGGGEYNATTTDFPFEFDAVCAATSGNPGSLCTATTSADALVPGAILEGRRSILAAGQVQVFDGGADGDGATAGDNTLFAVQGVFIP